METHQYYLIVHYSDAKTYKGTDIQVVASLYMLFMQRKTSLRRECLSKRG